MADNSKIEWTDATCPRIAALSDVDVAYIAGLIDGEGSVYVMRHTGRKRRETFYPAIAIMMTHEGVLRRLGERLGLAVANVTRKPAAWRNQHSLRIHGKRAVHLCRRMLPYLHVKRDQAEILQSFPFEDRKGRMRNGRHLSCDIVIARQALRDRVNSLNARGAS